MSEPKRHHYVPQTYLRGFADNEKVWVYDKLENKYYSPSLENVAVISNYYSLVYEGEKNNDIERYFAQMESDIKPIIEKIENKERPTQLEKDKLALFIAYQFVRVPSYENQNRDSMNQLMEIMKEWDIPEEKHEVKTPDFLPSDTPGISARELHDNLTELLDSDTKFKNQHLEMVVNSGVQFAANFLHLEWRYCFAPENYSFITTSSPFVMTFIEGKKPPAMGFLVRGVIKVFPITSKVCLLMLDDHEENLIATISGKSVDEINLALASRSDRYLFHNDKEVLEKLAKEIKHD